MRLSSFSSVIRLRDGKVYKVLLQHDSEYRDGCIDIFCKSIDTGDYYRIICLNPINCYYDSFKNYGKLKSSELAILKKEFFYKQYCC